MCFIIINISLLEGTEKYIYLLYTLLWNFMAFLLGTSLSLSPGRFFFPDVMTAESDSGSVGMRLTSSVVGARWM